MKCTKCKKIIPQGEELFNNEGYYHEECQQQVELEIKEKNERFNKQVTNFAISLFVWMILFYSGFRYLIYKDFKNETQETIVKGLFGLIILISFGWLIRCVYLLQ